MQEAADHEFQKGLTLLFRAADLAVRGEELDNKMIVRVAGKYRRAAHDLMERAGRDMGCAPGQLSGPYYGPPRGW